MPVLVDWDDSEKTILRYRFEGHWTWDELYVTYERGVSLNNSVPHRVDTLADLTQSKGLPGNAAAQFRKLTTLPQSNTGLIVIVGGGALITALLNAFKTVYRRGAEKYFQVNRLEQAYALINQDRSKP